MRQWVFGLAALAVLAGVGEAEGSILVAANALAFQDEGTLTANVGSFVSSQDGVWSPGTTGTVTNNYFATGTSSAWFDALSLEFAPTASEVASGWTTYRFRVYLQKGGYDTSWQHYQVLPGLQNPTNQDNNPPVAVGAVRYPSTGDLAANTTVGWMEFDIDTTTAGYVLPNNDIGLTLRLWNWRVDAVELAAVPEPATIIVWSLLGTGSWLGMRVWRRRVA